MIAKNFHFSIKLPLRTVLLSLVHDFLLSLIQLIRFFIVVLRFFLKNNLINYLTRCFLKILNKSTLYITMEIS